MTTTSRLLAVFCAVLFAGDRAARAATNSQTMAVNMTVAASCTLVTNPLNMGTWSTTVPTNASTTMSLTCGNGAAWSVDIDSGLNPFVSGSSTFRRVANGSSSIIYALHQDAARTLLWGTSTGGTALAGTGTGAAQSITVYGQANIGGAVGPVPVPGSYTDTVHVVVTF